MPLDEVDHSKISYRPFTKCFYDEHPEVFAADFAENAAFLLEKDVSASGRDAPNPVREFAHCSFDDGIMKDLQRLQVSALFLLLLALNPPPPLTPPLVPRSNWHPVLRSPRCSQRPRRPRPCSHRQRKDCIFLPTTHRARQSRASCPPRRRPHRPHSRSDARACAADLSGSQATVEAQQTSCCRGVWRHRQV